MSPPPGARLQGFTALDQFKAFTSAISWREDIKLFSLLLVIPTTLTILLALSRRKKGSLLPIVVTYICMGLIALAKPLNKMAAKNWKLIASQNYFDRHGLFVGIFWSGPLLFVACLGLLAVIVNVWQSMKELSRVRAEKAKEAAAKPKAE